MRTLGIVLWGFSIFFLLVSMTEVQADLCSDTLTSLKPCLASVTGTNPPPLSDVCCKNVKSVPPQTLCKCIFAARKIPQKCGEPNLKCCRFVDLQLAGSMDIKRRNIQHLLRLQARILYSSMFLGKSHLCRYRQ
ncbi:hypothetical protein O6H91_11G114000 [Diphasiastrum complanatum]|uniref:Uncharacterized protein n=1 Tax=Diphasiastrum complanatum TaxID=34168 RepID=A0ACC2CD35_DIPCM|nr:hypothetical protein O6H91_11G114000 [Diphasiastrum complanatum]